MNCPLYCIPNIWRLVDCEGNHVLLLKTHCRRSRQSAYGLPNSLPFTSRLWWTSTWPLEPLTCAKWSPYSRPSIRCLRWHPQYLGRHRQAPFSLLTMLRIHFLQQWFTLSDPGMEEAFFDTPLCREFAQLEEFGRLPDESTILRFRHRLEKHKLAEQILVTVNRPRPKTKTGHATPRCTPARRAISGTSA
jgi:hypothetical protein